MMDPRRGSGCFEDTLDVDRAAADGGAEKGGGVGRMGAVVGSQNTGGKS